MSPHVTAAAAPMVSVVIPVYNGARFLDETLRSVFAQDHRPIEVIVVDDGSTDATPEVLARWPEVIVIRQANAGVTAARNAGFARATGAFVAMQDADDLWAPHKLSAQLAFLAAHPELGYCAALVQSFLEPGCERPEWLPEVHLREPRPGGIGNFFARAEVMAAVGPFPPGDPSDMAWSLRAQELGFKVGVVPEVLLLRRVHEANISGRTDGSKVRLSALRAAIARRRTES